MVVSTMDVRETQRNAKESIFKCFDKLKIENIAKRAKFGSSLVKNLAESSEETELSYALKRLVRGLGATQESVRRGYYGMLVVILRIAPHLTVKDVLDVLEKELHISGSNSKKEQGEVYTGQILACGALIRSDMISKATSDEQKKILLHLVSTGKKRDYLELLVASFVVLLLEKVDAKTFTKIYWPVLQSELLLPWTQQTINTFYLQLCIRKQFPKLTTKLFGNFENGSLLLKAENLENVARLLMGTSKQSLVFHPIYSLLGESIVAAKLEKPFISAMANAYPLRATRNRTLVYTITLTHLLQNVSNASVIPDCIGDHFLHGVVFMFQENKRNRNRDELFDKTMEKFFVTLTHALKKEDVSPETRLAVIEKLLLMSGVLQFDTVTKSRIIHELTSSLDAANLRNLIQTLKGIATQTLKNEAIDNSSKTWSNNDRCNAGFQIVKLHNITNDLSLRLEVLKLLFNLAFLKDDETIKVGNELAENFKTCFFSALSHRLSKLEDLCTIRSQLVDYIAELLKLESKSGSLRTTFSDTDYDTWKKTRTLVNKLSPKNQKHSYKIVFYALFLELALQMFNDRSVATSSLTELFLCYKNVKQGKKTETDDPEWIDVVVDVFLNLLSQNSSVLRNIIKSVFPLLCKYMTPYNVHQILSTLDPSNTTVLTNQSDDESDKGSDSSAEESSEEEESDEETDDNDDVEQSDTANDKLRLAIQQAFGDQNIETDAESIDIDDMSDTEGERLDVALAEAFKQFKPSLSKKDTKSEEALTHFRNRVIDLLDIYIESGPSMMCCLEIVIPLLETLEFAIQDAGQLEVRVTSCLKQLSGLKKFSCIENDCDKLLVELLTNLLDKSGRKSSLTKHMATVISHCCSFVVKCAQLFKEGTDENTNLQIAVATTLGAAYENYLSNDHNIPLTFFKDLLRLNWDGLLTIIPILFQAIANDAVKPTKKVAAIELLLVIFTTNRRFIHHHSEQLQNLMAVQTKLLVDWSLSFLEGSRDKPDSFSKPVFSKLLQLLFEVANCSVTPRDIPWEKLNSAICEVKATFGFQREELRLYKRLCGKFNLANGRVQVGTKRARLVEGEGKKTKDKKKMRLQEGPKEVDVASSSLAPSNQLDNNDCSVNVLQKKKRRRSSNQATKSLEETSGNNSVYTNNLEKIQNEPVLLKKQKRPDNIVQSTTEDNELNTSMLVIKRSKRRSRHSKGSNVANTTTLGS